MIVVPPWINLTQEQQELYSKLQACQQRFHSENGGDDDDNCGGVNPTTDYTRRHNGRGGGSGSPRACKLLTMLRMREIIGSSPLCRTGRRYPCDGACSGMVVTPDRLAKVGAWNRRRLQNMILAVGPGTPASFIMQGDEYGVINEDEEDEDDEEEGQSMDSMNSDDSASEEEVQEEGGGRDEEEEEDDDDENEDDGEGDVEGRDACFDRNSASVHQHHHERTHQLIEESEDDDEETNEQTINTNNNMGSGTNSNNTMMSSMIHGGCINTASWLDSGWRISTVYGHDDVDDGSVCRNFGLMPSSGTRCLGDIVQPIGSNEYPTQLVTSGDDKLLRFWDVSNSMGRISPWPGGDGTRTPYSSFPSSDTIVDVWKNRCRNRCVGGDERHYSQSPAQILPGVVRPLATLNSGHHGNVFHVTTVPHSPGKLVTCGADGYLRLHDVETDLQQQRQKPSPLRYSASSMQSLSSVIISPEFHSENNSGQRQVHVYPGGVTLVRNSPPSKMCFSHRFLSSNVGLVCSQGGLLHFDLRVPPRSQKRGSLVPELRDCCRACVPWRLGVGNDIDVGCNGGELESAYVFAGGNHTDVGLYDLRMMGSSSLSSSSSSSDDASYNIAIQKYRPTALHGKNDVAVSGIDLSKDKREILVSYESDHIYSFPVFGGIRDPTLSDVEQALSKNGTVSDYASYGGHLNHLTFLKMARYAGPNDEYICTGSDSGHAWIYEKTTGAVVSLIKADTSTCNGVLPHPILPFFITYGIDSTAKLWRATTPVHKDVDDSDIGRFNHSQRIEYKTSMVAARWKKHKKRKIKLHLASFFPDEHTDEDNDDGPGFFHGMILHSRLRETNPFIGNDLMHLDEILTKNYFQCARSEGSVTGDVPVKGAILPMKIRVNLMKLHHQANRMGFQYDEKAPWIFKPRQHILINSMEYNEHSCGGDTENKKLVSYGCAADFIPDKPSDWLPFDVPFASPPLPAGMPINLIHKEYLYDLFANAESPIVLRDVYSYIEFASGVQNDFLHHIDSKFSDLASTQQPQNALQATKRKVEEHALAWDLLLQTVLVLKEAGNAALKASLPHLAARRYDKAINYCALAYIKFPGVFYEFLSEHHVNISKNSGYECEWTELLQALIMVRLNLAMVLLAPEVQDAKGAVTQAEQSLKELKPFASKKGVVYMGKKLASHRTDEPEETYVQAKALQAKAYFRLGSAQLVLNEYDDAVKSLECSVGCTREANMKVDAGLLRKLNKAKQYRNDKIERQRKKFKLMFRSSTQDDNHE